MKKKMISLLLVLALVVGICPAAFAVERNADVYCIDNTETMEMSPEEIGKYQKYIAVSKTKYSSGERGGFTAADLLEICTLVDSQDIGGHTVEQYTSTLLQDYLFGCKELIEITTVDEFLYITFETYAEETVYLTYTSNGLANQIIYDASDDTAYMLFPEETTKTLNFRQGTTEVISEELLKTIDSCIQANDYSAIEDNPHLSVVVDENNDVVIAPKVAEGLTQATGVPGFTSEAALLNDLKSHFPFLSQKIPSGGSGFIYCQYLSKNIPFKVVDNRNSYVRQKADKHYFAVSTALSVVTGFLSISAEGTVTLLTALGIAIAGVGADQYITQAVTLYKGAYYQYTYERYGLVYDSTRFNDYVQVYSSTGTGVFAGGYNNKDEFDWVRSTLSTPEKESISDIRSTCTSRYNAELNVYGWCENYYPLS